MSDVQTTEESVDPGWEYPDPNASAAPVEVSADVPEAPVEADVPAAPAETEAAAAPATASGRGPRTNLEVDLLNVITQLVTGQTVLDADVKPTPHVLAGLIHQYRGPSNTLNPPSSGAVSAALARWEEIGYIVLDKSPMSFREFTEAGRTDGLTALKAKHRADKASARKAAKEAGVTPAAPEPVTAETAPDPETADLPGEPTGTVDY